jgi:hypothetical protein
MVQYLSECSFYHLTQQEIFITPTAFDYVHNNLQKYKQR